MNGKLSRIRFLPYIAVVTLMTGACVLTQTPAGAQDGDVRASGPTSRCDAPCRAALTRIPGVEPIDTINGPFPLVSLEPYFKEGGDYFKAIERIDKKDCEGAEKHLQRAQKTCGGTCDGAKPLALAQVRLFQCKGQRADALAAIKALDTAGYPGMEREVRNLHRRLAKASKQPQPDALRPSLAVDAHRYVIRVIRDARALAKDGKIDEALALLRKVEDQTRWPKRAHKLALVEGELLEKAGKPAEAAAVYYRLWQEKPTSAMGANMVERIDNLSDKTLGKRVLGRSERLDRLEHLAARAKKTALKKETEAYIRLFRLNQREQDALQAFLTGARKEHQKEREAGLAALKRAERATRDPNLKARAMLYQGLCLRRLDRDDEAIAVYTALARKYPRDRKAAEALYEASRLRLYKNDYKNVREEMALLTLQHPDSPWAVKGLWQAGLAMWLDGDAATAVRIFDHLSRNHRGETELSGLSYELKARYWHARALGKLGRTQEAVDGYRFVIERFPLTYYAAMAWNQISALGVDPDKAVPFQPKLSKPVTMASLRTLSASRVPAHPRANRALELWRMGKHKEAKDALWIQLQFKNPPRGVIELLSTFHLIDGDIPASQWFARRNGDFSVAPYDGNARLWGLAYPAPEGLVKIADKVSKDLGSDPMLAFGIMQHESGFKRGIRSSAGALGLMQVMPNVAKHVRKVWFGGKGPRKLHDDKDNMRMGMTILHMLNNYFLGNLPLVVAGYNAGPGHASRWLGRFPHTDTDALVEVFAFPRCEAYTKKVIGSYYAYRVLYGAGTPPTISLTLPSGTGNYGSPKASEPVGMITPEQTPERP